MLEFRFALYSWPDGTRETAQAQDHPDSPEQNENSIPYWCQHCLNWLWSFRDTFRGPLHTTATGRTFWSFFYVSYLPLMLPKCQRPVQNREGGSGQRSPESSFLFFKWLISFVSCALVFTSVCVCVKVSEPLKRELKTVVSCYVDAGIEPWSCGRAVVRALSCWDVSLASGQSHLKEEGVFHF